MQEQSRQNSDGSGNDEQRFAHLFVDANKKIDKLVSDANQKKDGIDADVKKSIKKIVQDLASTLKTLGFPVNRIANEIVHQLKGRASRSWILEILTDEYKDKAHQESARNRKHKVATPPERNQQIMVGVDGHETSDSGPGPRLEPGDKPMHPSSKHEESISTIESPEDSIAKESQQSQDSATITEQQQIETAIPPGIGGICQQQQPASCKHCPAKDARIKAQDTKIIELEEAVRAHTLIKSAEELMHRSTDDYQQVEFSVPFEPLRRHMVYSNWNGRPPDSVWFNGKFDHTTRKVVDVRMGRTTSTDTTDNSRMTP
jgi:hypothetical protein